MYFSKKKAEERLEVMSKLIRVVFLTAYILITCLVASSAFAQDQGSEEGDRRNQTNGQSSSAADTSWVVEFLRSRPDLMGEVKRAVVERLRQQGTAVQEDSISDKMLLERLEKDESARKAATEWLQSRGYVEEGMTPAQDEEDRADVSNSKRNDRTQDTPTLKRRPPVNTNKEDEEGYPEPKLGTESSEGSESDRVQTRPDYRDNETDRAQSRRDRREPESNRNQNRPDHQDDTRSVRRPSAYSNIPSFRDLYSQLPDATAKLKRFGSDVFRRGTDVSKVTMDLPAGPDYVLGPGDGVNLEIWGGVAQRLTRTVDREGRLALPEAGPVVVAGLKLSEAQTLIQHALAPQFRDAKVDISVARLRTVRVYVVGDVQRPGPYDISSLSTPLNALYAAGGPTAGGSLRAVRHFRGTQLIREVDLYELLLHGVRSDVDRLQSGDTILVPPTGPQVTISGMVRRPAIYELKGEKKLSDVVELAGGLLVTATLRQVTVERVQAHDKRVLLSVNLPDDSKDDAIQKALTGFAVEDGDKIAVSPILPYSEKTVYMEGHLFRPGKYSYREGLTINDLLKSYRDVLPEPSNHAEIIRLSPPDFHPETIEFNLGDVLSGDDPIELKPFDTIRVFGRYEIDAPMVYLYGEVLRPGRYPLAEGMTAGALVRMAGGFKRSAYRETADVTSYKIQNGNKVSTQHQTFAVAKALDGEKGADVVLKPGDVVSIRQLPGWKDIGASVTLNGEIAYSGTYGIQEGERLSSVIKRAGGFRSTAYPAAAMLDRLDVRELAEKSRDEVIRRIESSGSDAKVAANSSGQDQAAMLQAMMQQQQQVLTRLRSQPVVGRMVINISEDISSWENTPADVQLRAGDVLTIPKRPQFVLVNGQVYNSSAQTYTPGKTAKWYLSRAGGATEMANTKSLYIVRSNGSVVSRNSGGWFKGNVLSTKMQPGDVLVVPEKVIGGSVVWKNVLTTAQFISSVAFAAAALGNL